MREQTRQALQTLVRNVIRPFFDGAEGMTHSRHDELMKAIADVQPAQVDLTQEMANEIVRKIHGPLTISQECSDWLRELAPGHDFQWTVPVGYSPRGGQLFLIIKTNGTLFAELRDLNGAVMWQATLVPPDFGKEPASG